MNFKTKLATVLQVGVVKVLSSYWGSSVDLVVFPQVHCPQLLHQYPLGHPRYHPWVAQDYPRMRALLVHHHVGQIDLQVMKVGLQVYHMLNETLWELSCKRKEKECLFINSLLESVLVFMLFERGKLLAAFLVRPLKGKKKEDSFVLEAKRTSCTKSPVPDASLEQFNQNIYYASSFKIVSSALRDESSFSLVLIFLASPSHFRLPKQESQLTTKIDTRCQQFCLTF